MNVPHGAVQVSTKDSPDLITRNGASPNWSPAASYFGVSVKSVHVIPRRPWANRSDSPIAVRAVPPGAAFSRTSWPAMLNASTISGELRLPSALRPSSPNTSLDWMPGAHSGIEQP